MTSQQLCEGVPKLRLMIYIKKSRAYIYQGYRYVSHFPTGDTDLSCEYPRANRILGFAHKKAHGLLGALQGAQNTYAL